ncbi:hypothetical protein Tco_0175968, partial [Tanacetum coccineum]
ICLDVVKGLWEDIVISQIDWYGYVYDCLQDTKFLELKKRVVRLLPINSDWTKAEMEEAEGFIVSAENSEKEVKIYTKRLNIYTQVRINDKKIPEEIFPGRMSQRGCN